MDKEMFLYEFLIRFNKIEQKYRSKNTLTAEFKKLDLTTNSSILILYTLRNLLVHQTKETLQTLDEDLNFTLILEELLNSKLSDKRRHKYFDFIITSCQVDAELTKKCYKVVDSSKFSNYNGNNYYKVYCKDNNGYISNIFFHRLGGFVSCSISSYDFTVPNGKRRYIFDNIYLETEKYEQLLRVHLTFDSNFPKNDYIVIYFNPYNKGLSINDIEKIEYGVYVEGKLSIKSSRNINQEDHLFKVIAERIRNIDILDLLRNIKEQYNILINQVTKLGIALS